MAEQTARSEAPATGTGTLTQLYLGLVWLGTSMWTAHASLIGSAADLSGPLGAAAAALPGVVAATLVTGASIAQAASSRFRGAGRRLLAGLALGTLFGIAAAAGIRFGYGTESSITVLAMVVGAASVLGGVAAILPNPVLEAALWATTWVFFAGVIFGVLQPQLTALLGAGAAATAAAQASANAQFTYLQSALTGLIAGVYAYRSVRGEPSARPWYLVAGAFPGLLLLAAEGLTRLGGRSLADLLHDNAAGNAALVQLSDYARLRHGLIVLAVGAVVAGAAGVRNSGRDD